MFLGYLRQTKLKVSEIVVLKSTQKGLPAPDSDASYNCGFSKGKWPSVSRHDGAAFTLPSMCTKSHACMAWLTRTSCSRCPCGSTIYFPRKSHSLRRIYVRGSSPFLLGYEKHPNYLGRAFENTCAEVKNKDLVCAKKQEIHANNSKVKIKYV